MALETATYISDLVVTNPTGSDPLAYADDHLRLLKTTLKNTFPNINGALTSTEEDLNTRLIPTGVIVMWSGSTASVPSGWHICDGTLGTPDLRDRFVVGAGSTYAVNGTGGSKDAVVVSHTHTWSGSTGNAGSHTHAVNDPGHAHGGVPEARADSDRGTDGSSFSIDSYGTTATSSTGISIAGAPDHSHTVTGTNSTTGVSGTDANLPPYLALAFIMKL
jgi:microcystin-dependent protein